MKQASWPALLLVALSSAAGARAQGVFLPPPGPGPVSVGRTIGFSNHGRHFFYSAYLSNSSLLGYGPVPWGPPVSRVTVFYYPPPQVVVVVPPCAVVQTVSFTNVAQHDWGPIADFPSVATVLIGVDW